MVNELAKLILAQCHIIRALLRRSSILPYKINIQRYKLEGESKVLQHFGNMKHNSVEQMLKDVLHWTA